MGCDSLAAESEEGPAGGPAGASDVARREPVSSLSRAGTSPPFQHHAELLIGRMVGRVRLQISRRVPTPNPQPSI